MNHACTLVSLQVLLHQVDHFDVAAPSQAVTSHVFNLIDDQLTIPLKCLGLVTLFNGINVIQTQHFIKITCRSYLEQTCEKYLNNWIRKHLMPIRPTLLPHNDTFIKSFHSAIGNPDPTTQDNLSKKMGLKYRNGIGKLIYALVTCRPDISYAMVK